MLLMIAYGQIFFCMIQAYGLLLASALYISCEILYIVALVIT